MKGYEFRIEYKNRQGDWLGVGDPRECGRCTAENNYYRLMNARGHTEKTLRLLSREVGDWRIEIGDGERLGSKKKLATECLKNICSLFSQYEFYGGTTSPSDIRLQRLFDEIKVGRKILTQSSDSI